jgi:hypothetical protein
MQGGSMSEAGWGITQLKWFAWILTLLLIPAAVRANVVDLGVLSYDPFIPGSPGSPGVDAFNVANFTGAFDLPPSFPVSDNLTLLGASLTLFPIGKTPQVFALGDIGPGFLLDAFGNPVVQVPDGELFTSAELTATLSATQFALAGGGSFTANSPAINTLLLPSSGSVLTPGVDFAFIEASSGPASTPEPASIVFLLTTLLASAGLVRRVRSRHST